MRKVVTATAIAGSLLVGGAIGYTQLGATPASAVSSGQTSSSNQTASLQDSAADHPWAPPLGGPGFGFHHEGTDDLAVAAKAIGISEDDLMSALQNGKTIADVAKTNSVDPQKVIDALVADAKTELQNAVTKGDLTQTQADELESRLTEHVTDLVNGTFPPHGPGFGFHHEGTDDLAVAAKAIGISEDDLMSALQNGKTIADVAKTNSVDPQKVIDALVADAKTELQNAVTKGDLTQTQADELESRLTEHVTDLVNGTFPPHGPGFGPPEFGPPAFGGSPPAFGDSPPA